MDAVDRLTVKLRVPTDNPLVLRVLARNTTDVDGWLCDKARFAYSTRRLTRTREPVG
jgi:hypothetical protein